MTEKEMQEELNEAMQASESRMKEARTKMGDARFFECPRLTQEEIRTEALRIQAEWEKRTKPSAPIFGKN